MSTEKKQVTETKDKIVQLLRLYSFPLLTGIVLGVIGGAFLCNLQFYQSLLVSGTFAGLGFAVYKVGHWKYGPKDEKQTQN